MPLTVGTSAPATLLQGDTLTWIQSTPDATPQEGATLAVRFMSPTTTMQVEAVASGRDWLITLPADKTKQLGPGNVQWTARATYSGGIVQMVAGGSFTVTPLTELGSAFVSHAARVVSALEAQYEQLAAEAAAEFSVGERTMKLNKMAEVRAELAAARARLAAERNGGRNVWRSHSVAF